MNHDERENEFEGRPGLVRMRARTIIMQRVIYSLVALFMITSMAVIVYNAIVSIGARATLLDCSKPSGQCYQEGQERTAQIVKRLIDTNANDETKTRRIVILTAYCVERTGSDSIEELQECVDRQLAVGRAPQ